MILVATRDEVLAVDPASGEVTEGKGMEGRRPSCLAADPRRPGRAWCGTEDAGIHRTDDGGASWHPAGLAERHVTAVTVSPALDGAVWVGTEPSAVLVSEDDGRRWRQTKDLTGLPSSDEWSFPPRPETHHVRWIACYPARPGRLWVAIEAGALVSTTDGGRSWLDRVKGGPYDTHEIAVHPDRPDHLRAAAGDGFFESRDGGATWWSPMKGLAVGYLRSVAVDPSDPDAVVISAASRAHSAYQADQADGRLYRREGAAPWERVLEGWPEPPTTIAPLLAAAPGGGLVAADERGVHRSGDRGLSWETIAMWPRRPPWLRGLAVLPGS